MNANSVPWTLSAFVARVPEHLGELNPVRVPAWNNATLVKIALGSQGTPTVRAVAVKSDQQVTVSTSAGLASPSPQGGLEEFRGDCASRASSSATGPGARAGSARVPASSARSEATSPASTSDDGGS